MAETEFKSHLKWARMCVTYDGRNIPGKVVIVRDEVDYYILIWVERKPSFEAKSEHRELVGEVEGIENFEQANT